MSSGEEKITVFMIPGGLDPSGKPLNLEETEMLEELPILLLDSNKDELMPSGPEKTETSTLPGGTDLNGKTIEWEETELAITTNTFTPSLDSLKDD